MSKSKTPANSKKTGPLGRKRARPQYLRLHVENSPPPPLNQDQAIVDSLCENFAKATGWQVRLQSGAESQPKQLMVEGHSLRMRKPAQQAQNGGGPDASTLDDAQALAGSLDQLLQEIRRTRQALWRREAELAACVPVVAHPEGEEHLAARLQAVLQAGAEAVGCQAAALYLLDEQTRHLKLRACWGLPRRRLTDPPRPLRGSACELEALVGHAVVLENTQLGPGQWSQPTGQAHWRPPEDFPSAVCVPVSSPTMPLGVLWVFCERCRDFSPQETNLAEMTAGRLAADLDREMLLREGVQSRQLRRQMETAVNWQDGRLPRIAPLLDDWELFGYAIQAGGVGGTFYDWGILPDGRLALMVGEAVGAVPSESVSAALTAAVLHGAIRAHIGYRHCAAKLLARVNDTMFCSNTGGQTASLAYLLIDPETGQTETATAGPNGVMLLRPRHVKGRVVAKEKVGPINQKAPNLGESIDSGYVSQRFNVGRDDYLLVLSQGMRRAKSPQGDVLCDEQIVRSLRGAQFDSAQQLVDAVRDVVECHTGGHLRQDRAVLVAKRRSR